MYCRYPVRSRFALNQISISVLLSTMLACGDSDDPPEIAESESEIQRGPQALSFDQGWRVDLHVRLIRDLDGDRRGDIIAFGNEGVEVALSSGSGFAAPSLALAALGNNHGFTPANSLRTIADVTGDGVPDLVAFGPSSVMVSVRGATSFASPAVWSTEYPDPVTWPVLTMADVSGDGRADIVGIDNWGVYVALALPGGGFGVRKMWLRGFSPTAGGWVERHPRLLGDVNNDGKADLIGFGDGGVYLAMSDGQRFTGEQFALAAFGFNHGWQVGTHIRTIANVNGDKFPDIVGFGPLGVTVATGNGSGWNAAAPWSTGFGNNTGWEIAKHPRLLGDVDGDGRDDVVGIGFDHVFVARSNGAAFEDPTVALDDFTYNHEWRVEKHPRMLTDLDGDGQLDLVGFFNDAIYTARLTAPAALPGEWDAPSCTAAALQSAPAFCQGPWRYTQTQRCTSVDPSCPRQCTAFSSCAKWENGTSSSAVVFEGPVVDGTGVQHCVQMCRFGICQPVSCSGTITQPTTACQNNANARSSELRAQIASAVAMEPTFDSAAAQSARSTEAQNRVSVTPNHFIQTFNFTFEDTGFNGVTFSRWDQSWRCMLNTVTAQPVTAVNSACSCATLTPAACEHDCSSTTAYTAPGKLRPASPYITGQECLTYDSLPVTTPADVQDKFARLWDAYQGSVPPTVTDVSFRQGLRRRLKLVYELWGEKLVNTIAPDDQIDRAISLYKNFPDDNPSCGAIDAPVPPAGCSNPAVVGKRGELVRCQRLLEPHASEAVASLAEADCVALLGGYLDLAAQTADDAACGGPHLRELATHKVFQLEDKQLGVIESAPTTLGGLPRQLWLFDGWFAVTRRAAGLGVFAAADQLQRDTSYLIGRFWDRMRANSTFDEELAGLENASTPQEAEQALGLSAVAGRGVEQAVLSALFTVPSSTIQPENIALTRPPLRSLPLLAMLGDGLKPLMDDLDGLAIFHDIACLFRDCRSPVTSTPSRHAWNILAGLERPGLTDVVAANPHALAGWTPVFGKIAAQQAVLTQAISDAVGGPGGLSNAAYAAVHPLASPLWGLFQHARAFHDHYEATGQFESTARNQLQGSLLEQDQQRVVDDLRTRAARLQNLVADYRNNLIATARAQLDVMSAGATLDDLFAQRNRKSKEMDHKSANVSGLRASGEDEDLAFGSLAASFATIQASLDAGAFVDVGDTQTLNLTAHSARFASSRAPADVANHVIPGLARGQMLIIQSSGTWAPTCALRNARFFRPDGLADHGADLSQALIGPEGYTVNWTGSTFSASSSGHSLGLEETMGVSLKLCETSGAVELIGIHAEACVYADLHATSALSTSDTSGSEHRSAASFSSGIRLRSTPFPEATAGSLLVILTAPGSATVREIRAIQSGGTSVVITEPSDAYVVINDKHCADADTSHALTVSVRPVTSQTAAATAALGGMAGVLTHLDGQRTALAAQGTLLPDQATLLRQQANLLLQAELGEVDLTQLPPQLTSLFDAFVSHEIVKTERQIEIATIERSLELDLLDMMRVNDEIRAGQNRSRLQKLIPQWMLRDLDHDLLRHGMVDLLDVSRDYLRPILELWYPHALDNVAFGPEINALLNADVDTSLVVLAGHGRTFVDALLDAYENAVFGSRPNAPQLPLVVLSFLRPGVTSTGFWREADAARSRRVWDAIDAHQMAHFEITPDDFYSTNGGDAVLSCNEVVPLIKTMAIYVVRPGGDTSNQTLNGIGRRFAGFGAATQSFVLPAGPRVYELARYIENGASLPSLWQHFELPVRYGETEAALTTFLAAPRQTRPVGLSAMGVFDVDFAVLAGLPGHGAFDATDPFPATEIQLIMEIDSRASSARPTWVSRCQ